MPLRVRVLLPFAAGLVLSVGAAGLLGARAVRRAPDTALARLERGYDEPPKAPLGWLAIACGAAGAIGIAAAASYARAFGRDVDRLADAVGATTNREPFQPAPAAFAETAAASAAVTAILEKATSDQVARFLAAEREDEARRNRTQYLASMSHDLRSPLNSILGFSELLLRGLDGEVAEADRPPLRLIQQRGRALLRLLNEILDTAKCEAGRMTLEQEAVMPAVALRQAMEELRRARAGGTDTPPPDEVPVELQPGLAWVVADPIRLPQAIGHLLTHALGTAPTGAEVRVRVFDRQAQGARQLVVEATHRGPATGADWEQAPFAIHRLGPSDLGLALPLARRLASLHGGDVTVENVTTEGGPEARFTLWVPAGPRKEKLAVMRPRSKTQTGAPDDDGAGSRDGGAA